ncbi:hypothetical protein AYO38_11455 [bacterium SCGC AG-212-C10]|nr:hypothetical protein AYO38_11455 [bacterium SCGC AG-212-C10]
MATSRAVIFDFGGVFTVPVPEFAAGIAAEFGLQREDWAPRFLETEAHFAGRTFATTDMIPVLASSLAPLVGGRAHELAEVLLRRIFVNGEAGRPREQMYAFARGLHENGFAIGLLSNGPADSEEVNLRPIREAGFVDASVLSGRDGTGKPHPEAYRLILKRLGGPPPENAYFIDDQLQNIVAARALGICSFHFEGNDTADLEADVRRWANTA